MIPRILSFAGVAALSLGLTGCVTTPPEQDPVVQKLSELDGRLLRLEMRPWADRWLCL